LGWFGRGLRKPGLRHTQTGHSMKAFRILHFSDIHWGHPDNNATLPSLVPSLLTDLERIRAHGPAWSLIAITGDLSNRGEKSELTDFSNTVLARIIAKLEELDCSPMIAAVPGNHDLRRPPEVSAAATVLRTWHSQPQSIRSHFWNSQDNEYRRLISDAFTGFEQWQQHHPKHVKTRRGLFAGEFSSFANTDGGTVGIVGLNSAFLHLFPGNRIRSLHIDTRQLQGVCGPVPTDWLRHHDYSILLSHHPPDWLSTESESTFRSEICNTNHFAIHLYGHMHSPRTVAARINGAASPVEIQASSLFGLDKWETESGQYEKRVHGYSDITILPAKNSTTITIRPRILIIGSGGVPSRMEADTQHHILQPNGTFTQTLNVPRAPRPVQKQPAAAPRQRCQIEQSISLRPLVPEHWHFLLKASGIDTEELTTLDAREAEVDLLNTKSRTVYRCYSGGGKVVTERDIELLNTYMDKNSYAGAIALSTAAIEAEALGLGERFGRAKRFRVIDSRELAASLEKHLPHAMAHTLTAADGSRYSGEFLMVDSSFPLLVAHEASAAGNFFIIDPSGEILSETHEHVIALKRSNILYSSRTYGTGNGLPPTQTPFERASYLKRMHEEFSELRYSAVAPIGVGFPEGSLRDLYVPAHAEAAPTSENESLAAKASDFVNISELDEQQQEQVEALLRSRELHRTMETDTAKALYQRYHHLLLVGDPGSGKTCFVKDQIISYCGAEEPWYQIHTPVYVALTELAPLVRSEGALGAVAKIARTRGLDLTEDVLTTLFEQGTVSFFFDGLDEVRSLAARSTLLDAIGRLIDTGSGKGNRFVITSRPAAVARGGIPDSLVRVSLKGLTDSEIADLARVVAKVEWDAGGERARLGPLGNQKETAIDKLIRDCQKDDGLRRLARNPLMLTLLVLIYVNSGPLSAKRHKIYEQAITTLVSVRNRTEGGFVFSEADLRARLAPIAMQIIDSEASGPLGLSDAARIAATAMDGEHLTLEDATSFLRDVGEATGIVVVRRDADGSESIRFMHQSFAEYYAAVHLSSTITSDPGKLDQLIESWRDVVSLSAGLIADAGIVQKLIRTLCDDAQTEEQITRRRLLFAFECALECDVAPSGTQLVLAEATRSAVESGPGRADRAFRAELGALIGRLLYATGSPRLIELLEAGVADHREGVAAAYIDLASNAFSHLSIPEAIVAAVWKASDQKRRRLAQLSLYADSPSFRTPAGELLSREVLRKQSGGLVFAAAGCAAAVPHLARATHDDLARTVRARHLAASAIAARALLKHTIALDDDRPSIGILIDDCLSALERFSDAVPTALFQTRASPGALSRLLNSPAPTRRVRGLRLLPWVDPGGDAEAVSVTGAVRAAMRESTPHIAVVALDSIRRSRTVRSALNDDDILVMIGLLGARGDLRSASLRAMGAIELSSSQSEALLSHARSRQGRPDIPLLSALAGQASRRTNVRESFLKVVDEIVGRAMKDGLGGQARRDIVLGALRACRHIEVNGPPTLQRSLRSGASNWRVPSAIRREAASVLGHVGTPEASTLSAFLAWIGTADRDRERLPGALYGLTTLVRRGRQRAGWGVEVRSNLLALRAALTGCWPGALSRTRRVDDSLVGQIRQALAEVASAAGELPCLA
jgi:predicted MPP superfamily phosphohydrolase